MEIIELDLIKFNAKKKNPQEIKINFQWNVEPKCPLCTIPNREILLHRGENIFLVQTKDLKGHKIRVMACVYEHRKEPSFIERSKAYAIIIKYMDSVMKDDEWLLVDDKYASCPDHWHLTASDTLGTPEELEALKKTPTVRMGYMIGMSNKYQKRKQKKENQMIGHNFDHGKGDICQKCGIIPWKEKEYLIQTLKI